MKKILNVEFTDFEYYKWYIKNRIVHAEDIEEMIFSDEMNISEIVELIEVLRNEKRYFLRNL